MAHDSAAEWSVERVRAVAGRLSAALAESDPEASRRLEEAAEMGASDAEALLVLRSELTTTRSSWESLDDQELVREAGKALAAGKRLSVDADW